MRQSPIFFPLLALSLAYFAMGVAGLAVVGALPTIAQGLAASRADIANAVAAFAITFAIAAPVVQIFLARVPRRTLLLGGLGMMALGTLLSALAPSNAGFIATRVVAALGASAVGPVASVIGASIVPREQQGRALATVFSGMTMASVLGVPLSAWLAVHLGWRPMMLGVAGFSLLACALSAGVVRDRDEGAPMTLSKFLSVAKKKSIAFGIAVMALEMAGMFVTYTMISPILHERFHATVGQVSFALFMLGLAGLAGNTIAKRIGDAWPAERSVAIALGILGLAFIGLFAVPASLSIAIALIALWAIGNDLFMPSQQRRLIGLAPESRGLVLAMNSSAIYIGMSAGSYASGRIYSVFGVAPLPLVTAIFMLAALAALWLSHRSQARTIDACPACIS